MSRTTNPSRRQGGFIHPPQRSADVPSDLTGMQQSLDASIRRIKELLGEKRRFVQQAETDSYRIAQLEALLEKSQKKCKELEQQKIQTDNQTWEEISSTSLSMSWGDIMEHEYELREKDEEILRLSELLKENGQQVQTQELEEQNKSLMEQNKKLQEENQILKQEKLNLEKAESALNINKTLVSEIHQRLQKQLFRLEQQNSGLKQEMQKLQTKNNDLLESNKKLALSETVLEHRLTRLREEKQRQDLKKDQEIQTLNHLNDTLSVTVSINKDLMLAKDTEHQQKEEVWKTQLSALEKLKEEVEAEKRDMVENMEYRLTRLREEKQQQEQEKDQEIQMLNRLSDSLSVTVSNITDQMLAKDIEHQHKEEVWKTQLSALEKQKEEVDTEKRQLEENIKQLQEQKDKKKKKKSFLPHLFSKKNHQSDLKVEEAAGCSI